MPITYAQLLDYFTPEELDDAATIARHLAPRETNMTYAEIYMTVLLEMHMY
jgi:hypothetical protein